MATNSVEIMDTTLRDGEQTPGLAFTPAEKLQIARILLSEVGVDRLEVGSARVSSGEASAARQIVDWARQKNKLEKIEVLAFVDRNSSIEWALDVGVRTVNLLTKGSEHHCRAQLRKTPEEHFQQACDVVRYAREKGLTVNVYLEDWSNGVRQGFQYVHAFTSRLLEAGARRIMLPDTLGVLTPSDTRRYLDWMVHAFPDAHFDFHAHNDYGFATANTITAVEVGARGVHTTVNGLGERAGNASLAEVIVGISDKTDCSHAVAENCLHNIAEVVQAFSGKRLSANTPVVGSDVFTQTCGVHADGDKKGDLYANDLLPERFSRIRSYALGKLSGKASIDQNVAQLGLELSNEDRDRVLAEVIRLGDMKKRVTAEDLPFIIADVLKTVHEKAVEVTDFRIVSSRQELPSAEVAVSFSGQTYRASAEGDGGFDALVKAIRKALAPLKVELPALLDYEVRIPPGGKTDALVETTIRWDCPGPYGNLVTLGIDSDQLVAAIEATEKMLNVVLPGRS